MSSAQSAGEAESNKEAVRRFYFDVWAKGDPALLEELLTDDYVDHNPVPGMSADKAGAAEIVTALMGGATEVEMELGHLIAEGDMVAGHWQIAWTQQGNFMGMIPADGKRLTLEGHDFLRLEGGRIAEIWHVEDIMSVMGQLGALPEPPAGT